MAAKPTGHKGGKNGTKKYGNNEVWCAKYLREHRREKNKIKKIQRHLKVHVNDLMAYKHIERLKALVYGV